MINLELMLFRPSIERGNVCVPASPSVVSPLCHPPPTTPFPVGSGVRQAFTTCHDCFLLPPSFSSPLLPPPSKAADKSGCQVANSKNKQTNEELTGATL